MRVLSVLLISAFVPAVASIAMAKGEASDRSFVDRAYSINEGEIELGKLAQKQGTTPQVVEFGQRMAGDHRVAQEQLRDVALADNLTLPHRLQATELDLYKRLARLHGQKFDDAYVEHMVSGHKGAIALFQEQADHGQDPQLRAYAEKELPMLRAHEAIAKRDLQRM